jgi:UDP-glucose 4-epimerase
MVLERVAEIAGQRPHFVYADVRDRAALKGVLNGMAGGCDGVSHFAGLKAVGESVDFPLRYYSNNVEGSVALFEVLAERGV